MTSIYYKLTVKKKGAALLLLLLFAFLSLTPNSFSKDRNPSRETLRHVIKKLTDRGVRVGCQVKNVQTGKEVFSYNPDVPLIPASNIKILTSSAALMLLGPDYRFKTVIYSDGTIDPNGVIRGNLYIKGHGDPFLTNQDMWQIAHELVMCGLKRVTGAVVADETFFDINGGNDGSGKNREPSWNTAEIGALSLNFNRITIYMQPGPRPGDRAIVKFDLDLPCLLLKNGLVTSAKNKKREISVNRGYSKGKNCLWVKGQVPVGSSLIKVNRAIKDPATYAACAFKQFLSNEKIDAGEVIKGKTPEGAIPLNIHDSKPLSRIITDLNKNSDNFIAEQILKTLGAEFMAPPGTPAKGVKVIKDALTEKGISLEGLIQIDGSGLSSHNRMPVRLLCDILLYMAKINHYGPEFISSLSIAGLDGTMKERLKKDMTPGMVRAKTGSIHRVSALSGYLTTTEGSPLVFSILMNGTQLQKGEFHDLQDKIVSTLSQAPFMNDP